MITATKIMERVCVDAVQERETKACDACGCGREEHSWHSKRGGKEIHIAQRGEADESSESYQVENRAKRTVTCH